MNVSLVTELYQAYSPSIVHWQNRNQYYLHTPVQG